MSATPLTKAEVELIQESDGDGGTFTPREMVDASFARALERHANELRDQLVEARSILCAMQGFLVEKRMYNSMINELLAKPIPTLTTP